MKSLNMILKSLFTRENAYGPKRGEEAEYEIRYNLLSQISKYVSTF